MSAHRVRRPTEDAAITAASRSPRRLAPAPVLLELLADVHRLGDRHGVNLLGHAVVRSANGGRAER